MPKTKEPIGQRQRRKKGSMNYNPLFPGDIKNGDVVRRPDNRKARVTYGDSEIVKALQEDYDEEFAKREKRHD